MTNQEFPFFNKVINQLRFSILEHGYVEAGTDWRFLNLHSPFNRLYFVSEGHAIIRHGDETITLKPGFAYLIPLHESVDYICDQYLKKFYIHFRIELLPGQDLFENCHTCQAIPMEPVLFPSLIQMAQMAQIGDLIQCQSIFFSYIARFLQPNIKQIESQALLDDRYYPLYQHIKDHCTADLRIKNLAAIMNLSENALSKSFKKDMGCTLKSFIDYKIIQYAQELLLTTDLTVKAISCRLKFLDEFHFSSFFKKHTGISPSKYRQRSNTFK